jgi:hypothetical protein
MQRGRRKQQRPKNLTPSLVWDLITISLRGGEIFPQKSAVPLFFELEKERIRSHRWMKIAKSKGVEDIGHMENKIREMGRELSDVRNREVIRRTHLETENELLRK